MSDMDTLAIQMLMTSALRTLSMIDTSDLEQHVNEVERSLSNWDTLGAIIDPTNYRNDLQSGQHTDNRHQQKITKLLLQVRQAIDERESFVQSLRTEED